MAWAALISAGIGFATSLLQSSAQNAAQSASKKEARRINKDRYKRALVEFEVATQQQATNYAWDLARTEAQKFMDDQRKSDYEFSQMSIFDQAMDNLVLNTSGLLDKYELEEALRANQAVDGLTTIQQAANLNKNIATDKAASERRTITQQQKQNKYRTVEADVRYELERKSLAQQSRENARKTGAAVRQYMSNVKEKRLQGKELVSGVQDRMATLQAQNINEMKSKQLERNIRVVANMMDQGAARSGSQRTGGSSSSRRLAMNEAQKLGRSYGEIQMLKEKQNLQMANMNADMQGTQAMKLGRLAVSMQNDVVQARSLIKQTKGANKILAQRQKSIFSKRREGMKDFKTTARLGITAMRKSSDDLANSRHSVLNATRKGMRDFNITQEGFQIAARQGQREATGLYLQTNATIDQASMPYRSAIIFDPLEPIEGIPPEKSVPSFNFVENPINSYANAIMGGAQDALDRSRMTSEGLKFY